MGAICIWVVISDMKQRAYGRRTNRRSDSTKRATSTQEDYSSERRADFA
jgi:hypothetical protein